MRHIRPLMALSLVLLALPIRAADPPPPGKQIVTRRYDVSPLLAGCRPDDRPGPADPALGPDDPIGFTVGTRSDYRAFLVGVFRDLDRDSWRDAGGWSDIGYEHDELVVTQTVEVHAQIARMLNEFKGDDAERAMYKFEDVVVPRVALRDAPLAEALAQVSRAAGVRVDADWPNVRAAGLTPETRVTLAADRLRAPVALRAICRAAGAPPDAGLRWKFTPTSVTVTRNPRPDPRPQPYERVYLLRYLRARVAGLRADPKPSRTAVAAAVAARIGREFPNAGIRVTGTLMIVDALPADHRRLTDRLDELETVPEK